MKRIAVIFGIALTATALLSSAAQAGLFITVDIGNNGTVEGSYSDLSDPVTMTGTVVNATNGTVSVDVQTSVFTSALSSGINTTQAAVTLVGGGSGTVRVKVLFTEVDLPLGPFLDMMASIASSSLTGEISSATNASYITDTITLNLATGATTFTPIAVPVTASIGPSPSNSGNISGIRPRGGAIFDLLQDLTINYNLNVLPTANVVADTVVLRTSIPEASSLVAWSLCAVVGGILTYRRRRTR
jgi:hypothetical protein